MNNSVGSAQNELNTYLDSVEAKTTQIKESWAEVWQSDSSISTMKTLLDMANGLIGVVNALGAGNTLFGLGGAILGKAINWVSINYQLVL